MSIKDFLQRLRRRPEHLGDGSRGAEALRRQRADALMRQHTQQRRDIAGWSSGGHGPGPL